jgi:hypothetical protein
MAKINMRNKMIAENDIWRIDYCSTRQGGYERVDTLSKKYLIKN